MIDLRSLFLSQSVTIFYLYPSVSEVDARKPLFVQLFITQTRVTGRHTFSSEFAFFRMFVPNPNPNPKMTLFGRMVDHVLGTRCR